MSHKGCFIHAIKAFIPTLQHIAELEIAYRPYTHSLLEIGLGLLTHHYKSHNSNLLM